MNCPVCEAPLKEFDQYLMKCPICEMVVYQGNQNFIYEKDYYSNQNDTHGYAGYNQDSENIKKTFRKRVKRLPVQNNGRILDIGCATGFFLEVGRENGFDADGLEICDWAAGQAKNKGFRVYSQSIEDICFTETYDMVTAWDVIEHVNDPQQFVKRSNQALKPGGIFAFTTPDASSLVAKIMGRKWPNYKKIPEHQLFFTVSSIKQLLEANKFSIDWVTKEGKYITISHLLSSLGEYILPFIPRTAFAKGSIYINPQDIMMVVARKIGNVA